MAVFVRVYWFNDEGKNIWNDDVKVSDTYSRRRMEAAVRNYRFDDLWINREVENTIREYIKKHLYHKFFTAVAIDDILLDPILVFPVKEKNNLTN